jgi:hypothetical protein
MTGRRAEHTGRGTDTMTRRRAGNAGRGKRTGETTGRRTGWAGRGHGTDARAVSGLRESARVTSGRYGGTR